MRSWSQMRTSKTPWRLNIYGRNYVPKDTLLSVSMHSKGCFNYYSFNVSIDTLFYQCPGHMHSKCCYICIHHVPSDILPSMSISFKMFLSPCSCFVPTDTILSVYRSCALNMLQYLPLLYPNRYAAVSVQVVQPHPLHQRMHARHRQGTRRLPGENVLQCLCL